MVSLFINRIKLYVDSLLFTFLGDFEEDLDDSHVVCVDNVIDFTSAFLFSVETQHTIG